MFEFGYLADHPEHIMLVATWLRDEWSYLAPNRTPEDVASQIEHHCQYDALPITFLCFLDGQPIGTAGLHLYDMHTHPYIQHWLAAVYIVPEQRGKGYGKQMTQIATDTAFELGVTDLYLATPDKCAWYESFGWQFIETAAYNEFLTVSIMKRSAPKALLLGEYASNRYPNTHADE